MDKTRVGSGGSGKEIPRSGWDTGAGKFHGSWQDARVREDSRRSSQSTGTEGSRRSAGTWDAPGERWDRLGRPWSTETFLAAHDNCSPEQDDGWTVKSGACGGDRSPELWAGRGSVDASGRLGNEWEVGAVLQARSRPEISVGRFWDLALGPRTRMRDPASATHTAEPQSTPRPWGAPIHLAASALGTETSTWHIALPPLCVLG